MIPPDVALALGLAFFFAGLGLYAAFGGWLPIAVLCFGVGVIWRSNKTGW